MKVGYGNYCYKAGSKVSKVIVVKHHQTNSTGVIHIGTIHFPKHCIGKRVRIKIEFLEDEENE